METIRYSPIGKEDIQFGTGTFEVTLADGRVVTLSAVDIGTILSTAGLSTQTLTGITLSAPTLTGTANGSAGTINGVTLTGATITSPTISGTVAGAATYTAPITVQSTSSPILALNTTSGANRRTQINLNLSGTTQYQVGCDSATNNTQDFFIYDAVAAAIRILITSGGVVSLVNGQLKFPATQVPSADANTLDDYEEGTWTPAVGGTATYTTQTGIYTKIGRQVTITCTLAINTIGSGSTSVITGIPFAPSSIYIGSVLWTVGAVAPVTVVAQVNPGTPTAVTLYGITAGNASLSAIALMGNGSGIYFTLTYFV